MTMDGTHEPWSALPGTRQAAAEGRYGVLLRLARTAAGLTLDEAGRRAGYSAATLSRIETGRQPLTDVNVLRHLASVFAIPPTLFGLVDHAEAAVPHRPAVPHQPAPTLAHQVREVGPAAPAPSGRATELVTTIEDVLFEVPQTIVEVTTVATLRSRVAAASADYRACRYRQLARRLPRLLRTATGAAGHAPQEHQAATARLLTEAYDLATLLLIKLHEDGVAWATTDRARQAAHRADDPLTTAETTRLTAIICRRSGRHQRAQQIALGAAQRLSAATGLATPASALAYGRLLATAAYTAATVDDRAGAWELLELADEATRAAGVPDPFGSTDVSLYRISVLRVLGDYGSAIDYARSIDPDQIAVPERRVRYWQEVAFALHARGRYADCYRALLAAESIAPQEVLLGRWAHDLNLSLSVAGDREDDPMPPLANQLNAA
jgi:transcriptional regulator with XRE-family HTH domain